MKHKTFIVSCFSRGLVFVCAISFLSSCTATFNSFYRPLENLNDVFTETYNGKRYRVVVLEFSNSAEIENFEITADASVIHTNRDTESNITLNQKSEEHENDAITNFADSAREMVETALFQSGRFEVVPVFIYQSSFQKHLAVNDTHLQAHTKTIQDLKIDYIIYGDLTDFEIKTQTSFWKVPFWVILLVGSFFIKDDDTRNFVWYALVRSATIVPLNSAIWKAGIGKEDVDLDVTVALDLRLVDSKTRTVLFSDTKTVLRKEKASNLELVVWQSDEKVKIKKSNAGKQIRFAAVALVKDISLFIDRINN